MSDPTAMRTEAKLASATALRCRELAEAIDRRRLLLAERLERVRVHHTASVWNSAAADASRERLERYAGPALGQLAVDIGLTAARLRAMADDLEIRAGQLLATAVEAEAMNIALEVVGLPGSIAGDALDAPIGPALPAVHPR